MEYQWAIRRDIRRYYLGSGGASEALRRVQMIRLFPDASNGIDNRAWNPHNWRSGSDEHDLYRQFSDVVRAGVAQG